MRSHSYHLEIIRTTNFIRFRNIRNNSYHQFYPVLAKIRINRILINRGLLYLSPWFVNQMCVGIILHLSCWSGWNSALLPALTKAVSTRSKVTFYINNFLCLL